MGEMSPEEFEIVANDPGPMSEALAAVPEQLGTLAERFKDGIHRAMTRFKDTEGQVHEAALADLSAKPDDESGHFITFDKRKKIIATVTGVTIMGLGATIYFLKREGDQSPQ